jgi:hypothetical protein
LEWGITRSAFQLPTSAFESAFAIAADVALLAAFHIQEGRLAAVRAEVADGTVGQGQGHLFAAHWLRVGRLGTQMLGDDLGHAVGQAAHPVGPKAQRPSAADARHLVHHPAQPLGRGQGGWHTQDENG